MTGKDPNAVAETTHGEHVMPGEPVLGTKVDWSVGTVENVFSRAQKLGDGTIIVMTTFNPDNSSGHVVIVANDHGVVGVVEGQDWGDGKNVGVITDAKTAQKRYGDGKIVGMGIIKRGVQ